MWDRYVDAKVDLKLLSEHVHQFFERKDFNSVVEENSPEEYRVIAVPKHGSPDTGMLGNLSVLIHGKPDDFKIEFSRSDSRHTVKLGILTTLLGGGRFLLRDLKSTEELDKLESEFWRSLDETVDHLRGVNVSV